MKQERTTGWRKKKKRGRKKGKENEYQESIMSAKNKKTHSWIECAPFFVWVVLDPPFQFYHLKQKKKKKPKVGGASKGGKHL